MIASQTDKDLQAIDAYVTNKLMHDGTGHGLDHIERVVHLAKHLAQSTPCDTQLVLAGAYLHDILDDKLVKNPQAAEAELTLFLASLGWSEKRVSAIITIIQNVSYSGQLFSDHALPPEILLEAHMVQDADRLDALGLIGAARTFYYGGAKGHPLHDPTIPPLEAFRSKAEYRQGTTAINHFYEKLLRISATLHTTEAKRIGAQRHAVMENFLTLFLAEYAGTDYLET